MSEGRKSEPAMLVNGCACTTIPADDRGFAYGDGVFRTMRVDNHVPIAWQAHMQRLSHDCRRLNLPVPESALLWQDVTRLFATRATGVAKIVITRGSGGRGYAPPRTAQPLRVISAHALPDAVDQLELDVSPIRLARQPALAGIKHLGRMEQVLARAECARLATNDALMLDGMDNLICTTMRNILLYVDGRWRTPKLTHAGVIGATRTRIMAALTAAGQTVESEHLALSVCFDAQAIIACNSVSGITPVTRVAGHAVPNSAAMAVACRQLLATNEE